MKKEEITPFKFESLTEAHRILGLPAPRHPLVSLINGPNTATNVNMPQGPHLLNYYKISYKPKFSGRLRYGQSYYGREYLYHRNHYQPFRKIRCCG
ncbi:hypothetical protein [Chitinophaga pinensis]|uniref:hypothetical protein n=1 Tax=Chitinophaga pinensis TaxID=79329 RepID=UPI0011D291AA|nr:hypothetical protein [Chitinophaga pinensis]